MLSQMIQEMLLGASIATARYAASPVSCILSVILVNSETEQQIWVWVHLFMSYATNVSDKFEKLRFSGWYEVISRINFLIISWETGVYHRFW